MNDAEQAMRYAELMFPYMKALRLEREFILSRQYGLAELMGLCARILEN